MFYFRSHKSSRIIHRLGQDWRPLQLQSRPLLPCLSIHTRQQPSRRGPLGPEEAATDSVIVMNPGVQLPHLTPTSLNTSDKPHWINIDREGRIKSCSGNKVILRKCLVGVFRMKVMSTVCTILFQFLTAKSVVLFLLFFCWERPPLYGKMWLRMILNIICTTMAHLP